MIMIVAYAGGHHFFVYPKGGHHFLSFDRGGSCVFVRCFAGSYRPPGRNNERSLRGIFFKAAKSDFERKKERKKEPLHSAALQLYIIILFQECFLLMYHNVQNEK